MTKKTSNCWTRIPANGTGEYRPSSPRSTSCVGLPGARPAGSSGEVATAKNKIATQWVEEGSSHQVLRLRGGADDPDIEPSLDSVPTGKKVTSAQEASNSSSSFFKKPGPRCRTKGDTSPKSDSSQGSRSSSRTISVGPAGELVISSEEEEDSSWEARPDSMSSGTLPPDKWAAVSDDEVSRKRKVPPRTTGLYVGRRAAIKKLNDEKERELQLEREIHLRQLDDTQLLRKSKIDLEKAREEVEDKSTDEIASEATAKMMEVIRIAKTSSNLKGTYQKSLKCMAAATLGCVEILKEREELQQIGTQAEEMRSLRREMANLRQKLENELEWERRKVMDKTGEAERYLRELTELKAKLKHTPGKETRDGSSPPETPGERTSIKLAQPFQHNQTRPIPHFFAIFLLIFCSIPDFFAPADSLKPMAVLA